MPLNSIPVIDISPFKNGDKKLQRIGEGMVFLAYRHVISDLDEKLMVKTRLIFGPKCEYDQ